MYCKINKTASFDSIFKININLANDYILKYILQSTQYSNLIKVTFIRKWQNGECNVRNFRRFFFGMSSDVPAFKVRVFASDFECLINISSRHSNSNFAHHIVIHWSLFKMWFESLLNSSHQRETIYDKLIFFAKLVKQWKSKVWAKFELECTLLIFIYSNSKIKVTC